MNLSSAFANFVADPIRYRSLGLAMYRISQLLHDRTNGSFDKIYLKAAELLMPKVKLPAPSYFSQAEIADVAADIERDGYKILPYRMTLEQIEEIKAFAFSTKAHGIDLNKMVDVSPERNDAGEARYSWWMQDVVKIPAVQKMILEGPYCAIAQEYLGCRPILAMVHLFIDRPSDRPDGSYTYHYDNEGPAFLKFFFFLTDVRVGTGAHYYIAGSQHNTKPASVARSGFYSEDQLFSVYPRDAEKIMQGPPGTILAEDTMGFHRGSSVKQDYRLMMQFEFTALNVTTQDELRHPLVAVSVANLNPGIASICRKIYVPG